MRNTLSILILSSLFFSSCAQLHFMNLGKHKEDPKREDQAIRLKKTPDYPKSSQPSRIASNDLVEKGKARLRAEEPTRAIDFFHEAINLDTSNGVAYFYLAYAKSYSLEEHPEQLEEISDLLDRSESNLTSNKSWLKIIQNFRKDLKIQ